MSDWKIVVSGTPQDLATTYGFNVQQQPGTGMAPLTNINTSFGMLDGGIFQRTRAGVRTFALLGKIKGSTIANLHAQREALIGVLAPDRSASPGENVVLQYTGGACTVQASVHLYKGLELGSVSHFTEANISLGFEQYDPYWEKTTSSSATLTVQSLVSNANYIVQRAACGAWGALGSGMNGTVYSIASASDGRLIVGGSFTTASGGTACRIAQWNGTWSAIGNAFNDVVYAVAVGVPDGEIFAGGNFTTASGFTACKVARWSGTQWRTAASGVQSGCVFDIKRDNNGDMIIAGAFITAGSVSEVAACNIVKWNVSSSQYSAISSGLRQTSPNVNNYGQVSGLGIGTNNDYWVVGRFNAAGATTNTACRIAKYSQVASAWQAIGGSGLTHSNADDAFINDIALAPNGTAHLALEFKTEWLTAYYTSNGTNLTTGGSVNSTAWMSYVDSTGLVYLGGKFTTANGFAACSLLRLIGGNPFRMDINLPAAPATVNIEARAIHSGSDGALTIGFNTTGTASAAGVTAVTNGGGAVTYPILTACAPTSSSAAIIQLVNFTTGDAIYFNLGLARGEIVTLDLRPNKKTFTSNIRGNIINSVVPGSDLSAWKLVPGVNNISFFLTGGSGAAKLSWTERFWSIDN